MNNVKNEIFLELLINQLDQKLTQTLSQITHKHSHKHSHKKNFITQTVTLLQKYSHKNLLKHLWKNWGSWSFGETMVHGLFKKLWFTSVIFGAIRVDECTQGFNWGFDRVFGASISRYKL